MSKDQRQNIAAALADFETLSPVKAATQFLATLGYRSDRTIILDGTPESFLEHFDARSRKLRKDKALLPAWHSIHLRCSVPDHRF